MSNSAPKYTMSNESINIVWEGKMHAIRKGSANFVNLRNAILNEDWDAIPKNLTVVKSLETWAKGKFKVDGNTITYGETRLPHDLNDRIMKMVSGGEDPQPLFNFWEKLQKNPSFRSVHQLWPFLNQEGIPFTKSGNFLAYKSVKMDYKDHHSGEFDNSPGRINEMPRNQISDDPREACHEGFHVGALGYASTFGSGRRIVVCEVDPADVVCVPYDHGQQKMRVCKYKVIGNHNDQHMSSTVHEDSTDVELDTDTPEVDADVENDSTLSKEEKKKAVESTRKGKKGSGPLPRKPNRKLDEMGLAALMAQPIEVLRTYASINLNITGASKIRGGKSALLAVVMKARK